MIRSVILFRQSKILNYIQVTKILILKYGKQRKKFSEDSRQKLEKARLHYLDCLVRLSVDIL